MNMDNFCIELKNIRKSFGEKEILTGVNFCVKNGCFSAITGPSGCGKSTFLNVLGLLSDFDGEYYIDGTKVLPKDYTRIRSNHIGFVFQLYYLLSKSTVKDNILLPLIYTDRRKVRRAYDKYEELVDRLGLINLQDKPVSVLSGGEKQRTAIARAMILEPDILVADEPTGALDKGNAEEIMKCFRNYADEGHSVIMVTHDEILAKNTDKIYRLEEGKLYES